ncbi:RNA polymerase, sigma-24 subunit, ECF subfamily [uncultured Woeseiaceae bacterium]|uniref:RNA polymerase, sigma-24 subunit, ECF subfamily n=1 Tax=uncultured Woeseiaceae bacterium TaxID=1983305 RepID=A0A7D9H389_9GAMM|nr:RNA polymerase, sigma-24 subunit, ECF subfamily [uncultured Woeseiaceae bacterium]
MAEARVIPIRQRDTSLDEEARAAAGLVREIRSGNTSAETEMVERYSRGLRYLLARRIGDDERARDLLQDTFFIAIQKLRETDLDNPARLAGYLRGIAVRVALNAGRQRKREPYPIDINAIAAIEDQEPSQFQKISQEQNLSAVRELLDSMPVERDRQLLIRLYVYDQDKDEIRRALGLDSLHFNRVLFRAKKRFRKILEKSAEFDDFRFQKDT